MKDYTCSNCAFKQQADVDPNNIRAERSLRCRRRPPTAFLMVTPHGQQLISSQFPPVTSDMWCGEYVDEARIPGGEQKAGTA